MSVIACYIKLCSNYGMTFGQETVYISSSACWSFDTQFLNIFPNNKLSLQTRLQPRFKHILPAELSLNVQIQISIKHVYTFYNYTSNLIQLVNNKLISNAQVVSMYIMNQYRLYFCLQLTYIQVELLTNCINCSFVDDVDFISQICLLYKYVYNTEYIEKNTARCK